MSQIHDAANRRSRDVKFDDSRRDSQQDGRLEDEVNDRHLLNMITQTAKKSSYNNSRRHGLSAIDDNDVDGDVKGSSASTAKKKKKRKKQQQQHGGAAPRCFLSAWCCGGSGGDVDGTGKSNGGTGEARGRRASEKLVLRDPTSKVSYNIEHLIGEGGFSKVLLVRAKSGHIDGTSTTNSSPSSPRVPDETENGMVYAAKIIPKSHLKSAGESFIKATMLERNILGKFHHPFLLKLYHAFQERDRLILVIDYCPGGSLHTHVNISLREKGGGFDETRAAFYVAEIALAMAHLHKHGIVHRDLKLENVLMYRSGHCAVSDFGASKRIKPMDPELCCAGRGKGHKPTAPSADAAQDCESSSSSSTTTTPPHQEAPLPAGGGGAPPSGEDARAAGGAATADVAPIDSTTKSIVGTPAYMAPEMLLTQPYDYSVDWWALGVVLFTMLKGRLPFDAPEEEKMLWRIVKSKPRYDPAWSQPLLDVLRSLLQKRPTTRLSSLKALSRHDLYQDTDWTKLEALKIDPPYVPSFDADNDTKYLPKRIAETALPTMSLDYKKGDSMKKLFRKFSHRGSFDSNPGSTTNVNNDGANAAAANANASSSSSSQHHHHHQQQSSSSSASK